MHYGEIFNVGSTNEVSMLGLAERVRAVTSSSSEIVRVPYEEAYGEELENIPRWIPDVGKTEPARSDPTRRERRGGSPTLTARRVVDQVQEDLVE
jgi:hypothetical protein